MATSDKNDRLITKEKVLRGDPYTIPQPERLYTLRPRYFDDKTSRGRVATFRIKTRGVKVSPTSSASASLAERVRKKLISNGGYADFLVQGMQVGFTEKAQVIQTFGDAETVYYFGRTPTTLAISGSLFDDIDNDWFTRFVVGYNEFLRGTQLAKNFELIEISTHNATFTGTLMNLQLTHSANNDAHVPFSCTLLIRSFEYHSSYQYGKELADDTEYKRLDSIANEVSVTQTQEQINRLLQFTRVDTIGEVEVGISGGTAGLVPGGVYAQEATTSFNETLGGIADKIEKLSDSINKFASVVDETVTGALNPINDVIGGVRDISSAAFSVVSAIDNTVDSVLDPLSATVGNLENTRRQLKNLRGTITSLPENLSEKISRFARAGGISNPAFLYSPSANISTSAALLTMKSSNVRSPSSAGRVGPPTGGDNNSADKVARL